MNLEQLYKTYKPQIEAINKDFLEVQKKTIGLDAINLKIYDVAEYYYNNYDVEQDNNYAFDLFCELEQSKFNEYLKNNNLETIYIGSTSNFYFEDNSNIYSFDIYDIQDESNIIDSLGHDIYDTLEIEMLLLSDNFNEFFNMLTDYYDLNDNDEIEEIEIGLENSISELNEVYEEYKRITENILNAHGFVDNFKDNQVEKFKEFESKFINKQE